MLTALGLCYIKRTLSENVGLFGNTSAWLPISSFDVQRGPDLSADKPFEAAE